MSKWDKITLFKFQQVEAINAKKDMSDIDKVLFTTCTVFNYTEFELDNMPIQKVNKLCTKVTDIFSSPLNPRPFKRIGRYFINYEISKVTLGQYITLSYFLSANPVQNAHYVLASVGDRHKKRKNEFVNKVINFFNPPDDHPVKAQYFLHKPITKIMGSLSLIIEKFTALNKEYSALFGLDKEVSGDVQADFFNKRYGWIYSASQLAEYERISLDEAMNLPIRQAFNDLAYLKALAKYQAEQLKQQ